VLDEAFCAVNFAKYYLVIPGAILLVAVSATTLSAILTLVGFGALVWIQTRLLLS
jgi:hypothetical protein